MRLCSRMYRGHTHTLITLIFRTGSESRYHTRALYEWRSTDTEWWYSSLSCFYGFTICRLWESEWYIPEYHEHWEWADMETPVEKSYRNWYSHRWAVSISHMRYTLYERCRVTSILMSDAHARLTRIERVRCHTPERWKTHGRET